MTSRRSGGSGSIFDLDDSIQKPPAEPAAAAKDAFAEEARSNFTAKQSLDLAKLKSAIASISEKKSTDADGTEGNGSGTSSEQQFSDSVN